MKEICDSADILTSINDDTITKDLNDPQTTEIQIRIYQDYPK